VGLKVDADILRCMLVLELAAAIPPKSSLLIENGGPNTFGASWASRFFFVRHNLVVRAATTKMREAVPANFDTKVLEYETCLTLALDEHTVPDYCMVYNMDETSTLFVPNDTTTRAVEGTRKDSFFKENPYFTYLVSGARGRSGQQGVHYCHTD
jgi:hypothetical protein